MVGFWINSESGTKMTQLTMWTNYKQKNKGYLSICKERRNLQDGKDAKQVKLHQELKCGPAKLDMIHLFQAKISN